MKFKCLVPLLPLAPRLSVPSTVHFAGTDWLDIHAKLAKQFEEQKGRTIFCSSAVTDFMPRKCSRSLSEYWRRNEFDRQFSYETHRFHGHHSAARNDGNIARGRRYLRKQSSTATASPRNCAVNRASLASGSTTTLRRCGTSAKPTGSSIRQESYSTCGTLPSPRS